MPAFDPDSPRRRSRAQGIIRGLYRFEHGRAARAEDRTWARGGRATKGDGTVPGPPSSSRALPGRRPPPPAALADDWGVDADPWSATCYKALREDAMSVERWNRLHPGRPERALRDRAAGRGGRADRGRHRLHAGRARPGGTVDAPPVPSLGTDGFGRSDTRDALRRFFEVDAAHIVIAVLSGLAADGALPETTVDEAVCAYGVEVDSPDPWTI